MLGNVALQCWTNSITKASVTTHHLLFLGDFRQHHGVLTASPSSPLTPSNYTWHSLSITQWERSSFWQENGEDWLGNKSCHKNISSSDRKFGPGHLYEQSVYVDWKATSCLNKPSDWQKIKYISYFLTLVIKAPNLKNHIPHLHQADSYLLFQPNLPLHFFKNRAGF